MHELYIVCVLYVCLCVCTCVCTCVLCVCVCVSYGSKHSISATRPTRLQHINFHLQVYFFRLTLRTKVDNLCYDCSILYVYMCVFVCVGLMITIENCLDIFLDISV